MSEENGNGAGDLSQQELDALRAQLFQQAVAECASQLSGFFPQKPDAELIEASAKALTSQTSEGMQRFLTEAIDGPMIAKLPGWGVRVRRKGATAASQIGAIIVPVDTIEIRSMDAVNQWVSVLALSQSPLARAALDLMGFEIQFIRTKDVPGHVQVVG